MKNTKKTKKPKGSTAVVQLTEGIRLVTCETCHGTGRDPNSTEAVQLACNDCGGRGERRVKNRITMLDCSRCGRVSPAEDVLLLNHRTKYYLHVQLCPICCRDMLVGLHTRREAPRVPFWWMHWFQRHFSGSANIFHR